MPPRRDAVRMRIQKQILKDKPNPSGAELSSEELPDRFSPDPNERNIIFDKTLMAIALRSRLHGNKANLRLPDTQERQKEEVFRQAFCGFEPPGRPHQPTARDKSSLAAKKKVLRQCSGRLRAAAAVLRQEDAGVLGRSFDCAQDACARRAVARVLGDFCHFFLAADGDLC